MGERTLVLGDALSTPELSRSEVAYMETVHRLGESHCACIKRIKLESMMSKNRTGER